MKQRPFVVAAVVGGLLVALLVAAFIYDSTRKDTIAKGITAGGVNIGGMSKEEAKKTLEEKLSTPLSQPLIVTYGHRKFTLSAARAHLSTDVDGMVQEAIDKSRDAFFVARAIRGITGGSVDENVATRVDFSKVAVKRLVLRVKETVNRDPKDATVQPSAAGINAVPAKFGIAIRTSQLRRDVDAALVRPDGSRTVVAQSKITKPEVTTADLAKKYPTFIVVDRGGFRLRFFKNLKLNHTYPIAVGQQGLETPAGLYHIQDKQVNPSWHVPNSAWAGDLAGKVIPPGPADPIKARWMGFWNGAGIHGTDEIGSLGSAASHGCVRMAIPDVEALYDQVSVGTPVYVA
ncbi:MAG TPA: L,D-transpeptidase/peptidoglycan binding protein [Thermoleophilaceae bacterium]|jgi:lipoprotein-anchoring transpeptidase ErfK/SrfK